MHATDEKYQQKDIDV